MLYSFRQYININIPFHTSFRMPAILKWKESVLSQVVIEYCHFKEWMVSSNGTNVI